jgi:hypothetical protein
MVEECCCGDGLSGRWGVVLTAAAAGGGGVQGMLQRGGVREWVRETQCFWFSFLWGARHNKYG